MHTGIEPPFTRHFYSAKYLDVVLDCSDSWSLSSFFDLGALIEFKEDNLLKKLILGENAGENKARKITQHARS